MTEAPMEGTTQHLTFMLGDEVFALEIGKVREVLDFTDVTRVPRTPAFMRGVINLRGTVVPVVDLRLKFGMSAAERTKNTCVIIVEVAVDGDATVLGCLADSVQEVIDLAPADVSAAPKIGTKLRTEFIRGMGRRDNCFIILLDIDRVFSSDDIGMVHCSGDGIGAAGSVHAAMQDPAQNLFARTSVDDARAGQADQCRLQDR